MSLVGRRELWVYLEESAKRGRMALGWGCWVYNTLGVMYQTVVVVRYITPWALYTKQIQPPTQLLFFVGEYMEICYIPNSFPLGLFGI